MVVSLGPAGPFASTMDGEWPASLPAPITVNATGAGDACVAALAAGVAAAKAWPDLLADAVAHSGAAAAAVTAAPSIRSWYAGYGLQ
jgi:tagatose 6-phosphate kinase